MNRPASTNVPQSQAKPPVRSAEVEKAVECVEKFLTEQPEMDGCPESVLLGYIAQLEAQLASSAPAGVRVEILQEALGEIYERVANFPGQLDQHLSFIKRTIEKAKAQFNTTPSPLVPSAPSMQAEDVAREIADNAVGYDNQNFPSLDEPMATAIIQRAIDGLYQKGWQDGRNAESEAVSEQLDAANKRADDFRAALIEVHRMGTEKGYSKNQLALVAQKALIKAAAPEAPTAPTGSMGGAE